MLSALAALGVSAGTWQPVDGSWNGSLSDSRHWSGGFASDGGANTISSQNAADGLAVTVDADTDITGTISLDGRSDRPAVLDVRGASLCLATQTVDSATWPQNAFACKFDGNAFLGCHTSNDSRWNKMAQGRLSDVEVKMWAPVAGVAELLVTGGTSGGVFDFVHPDPRDDTKAPNGARPTVRLFDSNYYRSFDCARLAFKDTTVYLPTVALMNNPKLAEISVSGGGIAIFGTVNFLTATNIVTLADGAYFDISSGQFSQLAPSGGRTEFRMSDASSAILCKMEVPDSVLLRFDGGRVTSGFADAFSASGTGRIEFNGTVLERTSEMRFKTTDDAMIRMDGGGLVAPEVSGSDGAKMSMEGSRISVGKFSLSNSTVDMTGVVFDGGGFGMTGNGSVYTLTNATGETSLDGETIVGGGVVTICGDSDVVVHGTQHAVLGASASEDGVLNIEGGTFEYQPKSTTSHRFNLGHGNENYVGRLNVKGGRFVAKETAAGVRMFGLGVTKGTGYITVSGGELDVSGLCFCTEDNAAAPESVFRQTGGLAKIAGGVYQSSCQSIGLCATGNSKTTRKARIVLDGGVTEASVVAGGTSGQCRGGTGWTAFEADGGYIRANYANAEILRDFDEAVIGAKGLTVDSDGYGVTIRQNLASKPETDGWLRLTGRGQKTIAGTNSVSLVADGGTVLFAASADNSSVDLIATNGVVLSFAVGGAKNRNFRSLMLGGDSGSAVLDVTAGQTLEAGSLSVGNIVLSLSGSFATGSSHVLVIADELSAGSAAAWRRATVSGLADGCGCDLAVEESDGRQLLKMTVRERRTQTLSAGAGETRTVTDDTVLSTTDTLVADVGALGALTVQGLADCGVLEKTGTGRAVFENPDSFFANGVTVGSGLLALPYAEIFSSHDSATLTVGTGTLELGRAGCAPVEVAGKLSLMTAQTSDAAVVKCNSDIDIAAPYSFGGCLVKRGEGTLTLRTDATSSFTSDAGKDVMGTQPGADAVLFDDFGTPPQSNYSSLTVAEGDLVLRGTSASAGYVMAGNGAVYIGMPVYDIAKPARLVIDGVTAQFNGAHFHVGSGVRQSNCAHPDSTLIMMNGARATVTSLHLGWNSAQAGTANVRVTGEGTVLAATEYFYLADSTYPSGGENEPALMVSDGATLQMPRMDDGNSNHALACCNQKAVAVFDDATLEAADGRGARITVAQTATDARLVFRNGSLCKVEEVRVNDDAAHLTMTFDDSEWSFDSLALTRPGRIAVETRGRGLVLDVPADEMKTFALSVGGDGGIVKEGEGTLVLSSAPTCTGLCRIESGDLKLSDGLTASGLSFAGAGRLTGGTFENTTLFAPLGDAGAVTGAVPVVAGAALTGRTSVDLSRTAAPLSRPYPQNVLVAAYEGAAPDVTGWRAVNTGVSEAAAVFSASEGEIRMSFERHGFFIILR